MNENPAGPPNPQNATPGQAPTPNPAAARATTNPAPSVTANPMNRPMEQVAPAPVTPERKSNKGLIAGIIAIVAVLLIGGAVAAFMLLNKTDPVTAAMKKIMEGKSPTYTSIDGSINVAFSDEESPISNLNIDLKSDVASDSLVNNSVAKVSANIKNVGTVSAEFDEIYTGDGNLYFRIDGVKKALEESGILFLLNLSNQLQTEIDCGEDDYCEAEEIVTNCVDSDDANCTVDTEQYVLEDGGQSMFDEETLTYFSSLIDMIEMVDGEWLKISLEQLNAFSGGTTNDSDISCITNLVSTIDTDSSSAVELYKNNPFMKSTDKDIDVASKNYKVYKISVDSEEFANYVNSIQNTNLTSDLYSCLGWDNNVKINTDDVKEIVDEMPAIYTEIDNQDNFSRLYLVSDLNEGAGTVTIDLNFSYPDSINVTEPEQYKSFMEFLQEIMSSMYTLPNDESVDNYNEV